VGFCVGGEGGGGGGGVGGGGGGGGGVGVCSLRTWRREDTWSQKKGKK